MTAKKRNSRTMHGALWCTFRYHHVRYNVCLFVCLFIFLCHSETSLTSTYFQNLSHYCL